MWLSQAELELVAPTVDPELKAYRDRLDAIEHGQRSRDADPIVDAFVEKTRALTKAEAVEPARQAE